MSQTCNICCRPVENPYRRYADGKIVEGCIDACHGKHLPTPSNTAAWHNRPQAKALRKSMAKRLADLLR